MDRLVIEPAERLPAAERAYRELRRRILDNSLVAGTNLLEEEAALMLGLSRTPAREAMVRLAEEGLVELRPRHGMRVKPISADDMREIYEVLAALEPKAAGLAAKRGLSAEDLSALENAVAAMDAALERGDLVAWAEADERFHMDLVRASGNRRLAATVGSFWDQAHRVRMATLRLRPLPTTSNADHRAVVAAIRAGKAKEAEAIHRHHREGAAEMLVGLLERLGGVRI
ncbi:GntR family transcriptional regulator [Elioraea sp.]|uniref:GntR family transcriptional regulator n=1 Tax=Elioraea sp. TaxID=2185103 RepID=UPI003F713BDD